MSSSANLYSAMSGCSLDTIRIKCITRAHTVKVVHGIQEIRLHAYILRSANIHTKDPNLKSGFNPKFIARHKTSSFRIHIQFALFPAILLFKAIWRRWLLTRQHIRSGTHRPLFIPWLSIVILLKHWWPSDSADIVAQKTWSPQQLFSSDIVFVYSKFLINIEAFFTQSQ